MEIHIHVNLTKEKNDLNSYYGNNKNIYNITNNFILNQLTCNIIKEYIKSYKFYQKVKDVEVLVIESNNYEIVKALYDIFECCNINCRIIYKSDFYYTQEYQPDWYILGNDDYNEIYDILMES